VEKAERLFAILDSFRRRRAPVTAETLASEHAVSSRTVYRDIQTLIALGARIEGEAGIGYVLRAGYFMPPLMFSEPELEALVLGSRWVQTLPDTALAESARNALAKIATASGDDLRARIDDAGLWPVNLAGDQPPTPVLGRAREAMRTERAVALAYDDAQGSRTSRIVWPVQIAYFEGKQILVAWCCLRSDFRHFRFDRIAAFDLTTQPYGRSRREMTNTWIDAWNRSRASSDNDA